MATHYDDIPGIESGSRVLDAEGSQQYWWLNANPSIWDPSQMAIGYEEFYSPYNERGAARRQQQAFQQAMIGDSVLIYVTSPHKYLWGKATVTASLHDTGNQELRFQKGVGVWKEWVCIASYLQEQIGACRQNGHRVRGRGRRR